MWAASFGQCEAGVSHQYLYMYGQHEQSPKLHMQNPLSCAPSDCYDCTLHAGMVSTCIDTG